MTPRRPFDAVRVVASGGPNGPQDVRPFLANVLRGRPQDTWLGPDVCEYLRGVAGSAASVAQVATSVAQGFSPAHVSGAMIADVVTDVITSHRSGRPLPIVPCSAE